MAIYKTQIQWGGPSAEWHDDADLVVEIKNRKDVVPATGAISTGTQVSWSGPNGNGNITFFDEGTSFTGSAQFPGEGPVGYRGQLKG
jgi:FtsP/CotA-like multicopper oxidase with cupredoxin domain